ncbi:glycoside hydrolase family 127 protein [Nonomuraea sp. NBC_00507]|uniref:glycoside hydrolase family 127 protein n=1 Tax=Nonomuraea sp. NBC_00507 TaxID=2976002 RepID=UPI002E1874C9
MTAFSVVEPRAATALRPARGSIGGGFWGERRWINQEITIPLGRERLEESGAFGNFRPGAAHRGKVFADSDVYKWLEAVHWSGGREPDTVALVAGAQHPDGYLNTAVRDRYADMASNHELYCAGHLMQAAVAGSRAAGEEGLLKVATRFADHLAQTPHGLDGHPVVEMGLVELYRQTGERRHLDLAARHVRERGHATITLKGHHGPGWRQDGVPLLDADTVEGHAVRAMYLAAGAADVAVETGDTRLLAALERQWRSMVAHKTYLTGGLGSLWYGEAFGGLDELAPDTAYAETCAAIGSLQWSWRMLLATGDPAYADLIERTLFNAILSGVSGDGTLFFYTNPLRVRAGADPDDLRTPARGRQEWYGTACCPPNVMRTLASLGHYLATQDADGIQLHQYATGSVQAGGLHADVETDYPWSGRVEVTVRETPDRPWTLSARIPAWAANAGVDGDPAAPGAYHRIRRHWRPGDRIVLDLDVRPRLTAAVPRLDVARGEVAVERGPLVYCLEQADHPGVSVDDLCVAASDLRDGPAGTVTAPGRRHVHGDEGGWPYRTATAPREAEHGDPVELTFVPYHTWANRGAGPMRVWTPMHC